MGEFDVGVMQPFYPQCERNLETQSSASQSMTVGDSSGDETFVAEILSPVIAPTFVISDISPPGRWTSRSDSHGRSTVQQDRHVVGKASDAGVLDLQAYSDRAQCNRAAKRFLSCETITSLSDCHREATQNIRTYGNRTSEDFATNIAQGESCDYDSNGCGVKDASTTFQSAFEQSKATTSSVMREIDIAVSMAHSRFEGMGPRSCDSSNQDHISSSFSSCQQFIAQGDRSSNMTATTLVPNQRTDACPAMTKDYASHNASACSVEDEWKRKSDYGSAAPAAHKMKPSLKQSRAAEALGYRPADSRETYSASGSVSNRNYIAIEPVSSESAANEPSRLPFETKINSDHDERNTASYAVGASLLQVQSSTREAYWPQMRTYGKQGIARSSGKCDIGGVYSDGLPTSGIDNKPVNLCLQQEKNRETDLGHEGVPLNLAKTSDFRKYTRSSSIRQRPYQPSKRRSRSQCSVSPPASSFNPSYTDARAGSSRQTNTTRDMGIDNRTALESYNKDSTSYIGVHGRSADFNQGTVFSPSGPSHMMVQDEAKTYAILSGRRNEDLMNPHALSSSGSPHQQQALYHHARHSHSIINYAGPHGQSPDLRTSELSNSPPVRDHRGTPSSSLPSIKGFPNVIVAPRQHQHSASPSHRSDFQAHDAFQRQYETSLTPYDTGIQESRHPIHQHTLSLGHHPGTSTFSPLHFSPPQHHLHHQQASQYLVKHQQKKDYFDNLTSHSGLGTSGSLAPYTGSLQVAQHHGYLKPPPVDLDDLSDDERERMRVKRERNRVAAAKCRNRRRELLERLEKEAEQLEREQELLRENVRRLRVQKLQLGNMLEEHEPTCQKNVTDDHTTSPEAQNGGRTKDEQPKSASSGGLESGESSSSKTTSSPPIQLTTQA